jgi:plastocyanin
MIIASNRKPDKPADRRFARIAFSGSARIITAVTILYMAMAHLSATPARLISVTQKGQRFNPSTLSIQRGQTVAIVNDDGELIHHAYVDSKSFSFDSGDQEPGSTANIDFSVPGDFVVLCGIHPKMRLKVEVK